MEVGGGSIGCAFARLWKQEVGAILSPAGTVTPWDMMPLIGATNLLGYEWLALCQNPVDGQLSACIYEPLVTPELHEQPTVLVVPKETIPEVSTWMASLRHTS